MIFTVAEFRALQAAVDGKPMTGHTIDIAEAALRKVHANTDWSTDPAFDVHKEPKP